MTDIDVEPTLSELEVCGVDNGNDVPGNTFAVASFDAAVDVLIEIPATEDTYKLGSTSY